MGNKPLSYQRFLDLHMEGGPASLYMVLEHYKPIGYMEFHHNSLCLLDLNLDVVEVFRFKDVKAVNGTFEQNAHPVLMRFPDFCRMEMQFHNETIQRFDILDVALYDQFPKMNEVLVALHHYMKGPGRAYWTDPY